MAHVEWQTIDGHNGQSRSKIEAVAKDHFHDEMIGSACYSHAQAEIDFPLGRNIQIDGGKKLVLLLTDGIESRNRPYRAVVFKTSGDLGSEVVAKFEVRREDNALVHVRAVPRAVESGIE